MNRSATNLSSSSTLKEAESELYLQFYFFMYAILTLNLIFKQLYDILIKNLL